MSRSAKSPWLAILILSAAGTVPVPAQFSRPTVVTLVTKSGALEIAIDGENVTATLDRNTLPASHVSRQDGVVVITDGDGAELARVDLSPDSGRYASLGGQKRMRIGVQLGALDEAVASHLGLVAGENIIISDVTDGMPAAQAGIQKHDVITAIGGETPATEQKLHEHLDRLKPGATLELRLMRRGRPLEVVVRPVLQESDDASAAAGRNWRFDRNQLAWDSLDLTRRSNEWALNAFTRPYTLHQGSEWRRVLPSPAAPESPKATPDATKPEGQDVDLKARLETLEGQLQRIQELLHDLNRKAR